MSSLGFVVLARRPNPWAQDPWDYWAVGKLYRTEAAAGESAFPDEQPVQRVEPVRHHVA